VLRVEDVLSRGHRGDRVRGVRRCRRRVRVVPGDPRVATRSDHSVEVRDMRLASLFLVLGWTTASAQPATDVLTLERALELAVKTQPSVRQTRATVEAANARVEGARVARRPTVTLSAGVDVGSTRPTPCADDPSKTCGGFFDPTASTGLAAQASW